VADQWIEAGTALELFGQRMAICERCHAGLIRSRASLFHKHDEELRDVDLPRAFWWATGHEALEQNWDSGDFSTWIDQTFHWRAYDVRFALDDLLELIPFNERAAVRRGLSVAVNPAWISAREARRFAYDQARLQPATAGNAIIDQCRLGFVLARAVEMRAALSREPENWSSEAREWDVPLWFWKDFTGQDSSTQSWETGTFAGRGRAPNGYSWLTLNGVHFLRSSLDILLPSSHQLETGQARNESPKSPLPDAELVRWWNKRSDIRDKMSQEELWALAKANFPDHSVTRDRIRELAGGRSPGPKTK
jgi:hypothetical protein